MYLVATYFISRNRPAVPRLENLIVADSFPSGHTAASVALYGSLAIVVWSLTRRPLVAQDHRSSSPFVAPIIVATSRVLPRHAQPHRRDLRRPDRGGLCRRRVRRRAPGLVDAHERRVEARRRASTAADPGRRCDDFGRGGRASRQDARRGTDRAARRARPTPASTTRSGSRCRRASTHRSACARRSTTAPTCCSCGAATAWCSACIDAVGDRAGRAGDPACGYRQPARPQPRHPDRPGARGRRRRCTAPAGRSTSVASTASGSR